MFNRSQLDVAYIFPRVGVEARLRDWYQVYVTLSSTYTPELSQQSSVLSLGM